MQELCTDLVDVLQEKETPVVWVLGTEKMNQHLTTIDVLKYLIIQLVQLTHLDWNQTLVTSVSAVFEGPVPLDECLICLERVLRSTRETFIIMDCAATSTISPDFWLMKFLDVFKSFNDTRAQPNIKVALIGYGVSITVSEAIQAEWKDRLMVTQPSLRHPSFHLQKRQSPSSLARMGDNERPQLSESIKKLDYTKINESFVLSSSVDSQHLSHKPYLSPDQELHDSLRQMHLNTQPTTTNSILTLVPSRPKTGHSIKGSKSPQILKSFFHADYCRTLPKPHQV